MRDHNGRDLREEFEVTGSALLDKVKELIAQGNIRRIIVRRANGKTLADIPLTAGVGIAGILTLVMPMLVALGAIAALVAQFRIEIEREQPRYPDRSRDD